MKVNTIQNFIESNKNPEILFWVGCAGSFDERYKKVTKAFIKILNKFPNWKAIAIGDEPREKLIFTHKNLKKLGFLKHEKVLDIFEKVFSLFRKKFIMKNI